MIDDLNPSWSFGQPSRSTLWCQTCGRFQACSPASAMRYARVGWPRCCDHAMSNLDGRDSWAAGSPDGVKQGEEERPEEGRPGDGPSEAKG